MGIRQQIASTARLANMTSWIPQTAVKLEFRHAELTLKQNGGFASVKMVGGGILHIVLMESARIHATQVAGGVMGV